MINKRQTKFNQIYSQQPISKSIDLIYFPLFNLYLNFPMQALCVLNQQSTLIHKSFNCNYDDDDYDCTTLNCDFVEKS